MLRRIWGRFVICFCLIAVSTMVDAQYVVTGGTGTPMKVDQSSGDSSERLQVYLVYGMSNVSISYTSSSTSTHQWYRYQTKRLVAEEVSCTQTGSTSTITDVEDGYGYFVEEGAVSYYVWIIDYSKYQLNISDLYVSDETSDPCSEILLAGTGTIEPMYYYWPNSGERQELTRQYDLSYNTLEYDEDDGVFVSKEETSVIEGDLFGTAISAPLCDTEICVSGDYFARYFGKEVDLCTDYYQAVAVEAHIDTVMVEQSSLNMYSSEDGYCAPVDIEFTAVTNTPTAAIFSWTIYNEEDEDNPIVWFSGEEVDYTFKEAGTFIVHLEVNDQTTTCSVEDEMEIEVSESYLQVPNVFSPGTTPGVNDEFRVAYRSLVTFKAWIFNRWGLQIYYWTDPAQGWDGKKGGKYVQPGVYFYVIEAEGSDGVKYKKKGDINILRPKTVEEEE